MLWRGRLNPWFLIYLFTVIVYLVVLIPAPGLSYPGASHDDGLFMKWSLSILDGSWLGPWNDLTTSKGPLHSLLSAAAASIGMNPFSYKRTFYLLASLIFVSTALAKAPHWLRLLTLITLLTDPFQYGPVGLRNLREGTYIPLQLLSFGLGAWSIDRLREAPTITRSLVAGLSGAAICFGLLLITREGGLIVWAEVFFGIIIGLVVVARSCPSRLRRHWRRRFIRWPLICLAMIILILLPSQIIASLNQSYYGVRISNSMDHGAIPKLYGSLIAVRHNQAPDIPRVPIRQKTIDALIQSAPPDSFLGAVLSNLDPAWKEVGCAFYAETCGDYGGGWFVWSLRQSIGDISGPTGTEQLFQTVAKEATRDLERLCSRKDLYTSGLTCERPRGGYLPAISRWGFNNAAAEIFQVSLDIASLVVIPSDNPLGGVDFYENAHLQSSDLAIERLGIPHQSYYNLSNWQKVYRSTSILGLWSQSVLISLTIVSVLFPLFRYHKVPCLLDPVTIWLCMALFKHVGVYTLIEVTSFPAGNYVILARSMYIALLARICMSSLIGRTQASVHGDSP
jgi:hypothetical protein